VQCRRYFRGHWHPAARQRQNNHFMTPEFSQCASEFASSIDTIPERHDSTFIVIILRRLNAHPQRNCLSNHCA